MTERSDFVDDVNARIAARPEGEEIFLTFDEPGILADHELKIGSLMGNGRKPYAAEIPFSHKPRLVGRYAVSGIAYGDDDSTYFAILDTRPPYIVRMDPTLCKDVFRFALDELDVAPVVREVEQIAAESASVAQDAVIELRTVARDTLSAFRI